MERQLWNDTESEKIMLCQMLLDNKIIQEVNSYIRKEAFWNTIFAKCFELISKAFVAGMKVDQTLFMSEFKEIQMDVKLGIIDAAFSASNWKFYAEKIRNCYTARELQKLLLARASVVTPENANEIATKAMTEISDVLSSVVHTEIYTYADMIPQYMEELEKRYNSKGGTNGAPTKLENLDDLLGGGIPDEYIFLGARPSIGKTALALQIANAMTERKKTLFIELEMSQLGITERTVVNMSKIDIRKLRSGLLTVQNFEALQRVCGQLYENQNMIFSFPKKRNILDVIATIRAQVAINGVNAVFIDHIGLIKPEGVYHSSWEGVREISNTLQMLQRELNIPIFTLIQLNREAERKDADLANISGSDVIVQDADIIMTLERKRQENQDETIIPATLRILKNRNGACGECPLVFIPHHVVFAVDTNPQQREERKPA